MEKKVLASKFDLPFYLRLPSSAFFTWDPEFDVAAILPCQRIGEVSFSKSCVLIKPECLLDSICPPIENSSGEKVLMTCKTKDYREIPTLHINTGSTGGFSELRPYTEIVIFIITTEVNNSLLTGPKARAFEVLNHFIDIYRLITQDPYVYRIDEEFDTYLVDYSLGTVPPELETASAVDILSRINDIRFPRDIGKGRQLKYRLNSLDDLFPGKIFEKNFLDMFVQWVKDPYDVPLHYELILTAQVELKRRNYHIAILEAETAFEVYVASVLAETSVAIGLARDQVIADMENPKKLGLLSKRLTKLDSIVEHYRKAKSLPKLPGFVNSAVHINWKNNLYELRNRIIHAGWRLATFDSAKAAIQACKVAIRDIEDHIPGISNPIQIYSGVEHLKNTAGRLKF